MSVEKELDPACTVDNATAIANYLTNNEKNDSAILISRRLVMSCEPDVKASFRRDGLTSTRTFTGMFAGHRDPKRGTPWKILRQFACPTRVNSTSIKSVNRYGQTRSPAIRVDHLKKDGLPDRWWAAGGKRHGDCDAAQAKRAGCTSELTYSRSVGPFAARAERK